MHHISINSLNFDNATSPALSPNCLVGVTYLGYPVAMASVEEFKTLEAALKKAVEANPNILITAPEGEFNSDKLSADVVGHYACDLMDVDTYAVEGERLVIDLINEDDEDQKTAILSYGDADVLAALEAMIEGEEEFKAFITSCIIEK